MIGVRTTHGWTWPRAVGAVALAAVFPALIVAATHWQGARAQDPPPRAPGAPAAITGTLFESGALHVPVAETFALERAAEAYDRFAEGGKIGKIVLITDGG